MKKTFTILIFLICLQLSTFAQTKLHEFSNITGHDMTGHIEFLIINLQENPKNNAVIIIYSGTNRERFGNIDGVVSGIKKYEQLRTNGKYANRISIVVAKGKTPLAQEYWIIEEGDKMPKFEKANTNFDNLKEKHLFAIACVVCQDEYGDLGGEVIDWNLLAMILKDNPNYKIFISVGNYYDLYDPNKKKSISTKEYMKELRKWVTKEHNINKKRFSYKINEGGHEEIYIIPH